MRRWGVILLVLALSAIWLGAAGAQAGPAALGEAQVYIGQGDKLWESGGRQPLTQEAVSTVYAQSPSYLVYAAASGEDRGQALYAMDLTGAHPRARRIGQEIAAAVWSREDGVVYYVSGQAPKALYAYDPVARSSRLLTQAQAPIAGLRLSADGLLAQVEGREMLYIPVVRMLAAPLFSRQGYVLEAGQGFETLLDREGGLRLRRKGQEDSVALDSGVAASRIAGEDIYYLAQRGTASALMVYEVVTGKGRQLCLLDMAMQPQLAVDAGAVYLMDQVNNVYVYDLTVGRLDRLGTVGLQRPILEAGGGMALIYDQDGAPGQRFVAAMAGLSPEASLAPSPDRHVHRQAREKEPEAGPEAREKDWKDAWAQRKGSEEPIQPEVEAREAAPEQAGEEGPAREKEPEAGPEAREKAGKDAWTQRKGNEEPIQPEVEAREAAPEQAGEEGPAAREKEPEAEPAVPEGEDAAPEPAKEEGPSEAIPEPEAGGAMRTLSLGMWGDDVRRMQQALEELGYLSGAEEGVFDEITRAVVMELQSHLGLAPTGEADGAFQIRILEGLPEEATKQSQGKEEPAPSPF